MGSDNKKDNPLFLVLLLFIGAGALFFMYMKSPAELPKSKDPRVSSEKFEKSVNKNLMLTNENIEMAQKRMQIENSEYAKEFSSTAAQKAFAAENKGLDLSADTGAAEVANDLGRGEKRSDTAIDPHEIVQGEMLYNQQSAEYNKAYKEEYARQFVENARRGGYKVILSDDYKVLSVTPIRKPTQIMNLFEGDAASESQ